MITSDKVTLYSKTAAIIFGIAIFAVGFCIGNWQSETEDFSDENSDLDGDLKQDASIISFTSLDMETRELPPIPSEEEWQLVVENSGVFKDRLEDDFKMYGDLAKRYYSSDEYKHLYIKVIEVDLTSDDKLEKVVSFDGGGTYGIIKYEVIRENKIISTIEPSSVGRSGAFLPDPSENGFTMVWYRDNETFPNGYCCPVTKMITRFVFEENIFKPVYEQRILKSQAIDNESYSEIMSVSVGTKWVYEGKRLFYNPVEQKVNETIAQKVAEVTNIEKAGGSLKVSIKETYKSDPDFTEREATYLLTESGFDFGTGKIILFPLTQNQVLRESDIERGDDLYNIHVSKVYEQDILGTEYQCYDITNSTLGSTSFKTFCEGIGYVRDYYEHHGTPNKSDYKLIKIETPNI